MAQKFTTGITVRDLASAASDAVAVSVAGDSNDRIKFEAGGKVVWGSGASAGDVNLYRDAADRLKTDDAFQSDGGLITVTTAGTPTLSLPDGALAIDTTNNLLYIRTGGAWEIASGGGASVTTSDNAPSAPEDGDLWYETDTGSMFVYYDDGASQQWVEVGTAGVIAMTTSSTAPTTPANGDLWFDTDTARTYVYYDDGTSQQWVEVGAASAAASGQDGYVQFATGGTFNSASALVWDDTNKRLGVGTSTPAYPLDVTGTARATSFTSQTVGATTSISSSGPLFSGSFAGDYVFINDPSTSGAGGLQATGNVTIGGNLNVDTSTLHVDSTNNRVGIGTTTPNNQLQVAGNVYLGNFQNVTPDANGNGHLMIGGAGYVGFASLDGSAMWVGHNSGSRNLNFAIDETARMTLDTSGRLGIGTTSPSKPLHIVYDDPTIQLTDTNTNADSIISANSSVGSLILGADENNEVGSSQIAFKVDGVTRMGLQATGNLEMLGGTVKGDGALVQMVTAYSGVSDLTSSANIASITMSPKYSDSTMLVFVNFHAYKYNTSTSVNNQYQLYQSGGGNITSLHNYQMYSPLGDSYMFQGMVSGTIAAGSTASRTYHYYVTASSASDRIYFYWKRIYVLEIAT